MMAKKNKTKSAKPESVEIQPTDSHLLESQNIIENIDSAPNFRVEQEYSDLYLQDNYDPEQYNMIRNLLDGVSSVFDTFIQEFPEYGYLRSIDIQKVRAGDKIYISIINSLGTIEEISNGYYYVRVDGHLKKVVLSELKPVDEYISKLKMTDTSKIYNFIRDKVDKTMFGEIEFFDAFSKYFKLDYKILYDSLNQTVQFEILQELNKRTGVLDKKGIRPLF